MDGVKFGDGDYKYKEFDLIDVIPNFEGVTEEWFHMKIFLSKGSATLFIGDGD